MARADFLERVRGYGFLVTLGLTIAAGYYFVPPADAGYATVDLGGVRGLYNSAWVGGIVALLTTIWGALAGFYVVKNPIQRDIRTGVGQILAGTPLSRPLYTLGKALSNFLVLALMTAILAVVALAMQLLRAEDLRIQPWELFAPFLLVALPAMAVTAALAVLFETIGWLRGSLGNLLYYFLYMAIVFLGGGAGLEQGTGGEASGARDLYGLTLLVPNMVETARAAYPASRGMSVGFSPVAVGHPLQTFVWQGVAWTPAVVAGRLMWVGVALAISLAAALFFTRFDPSRERARARGGRSPYAATDGQDTAFPATAAAARRDGSAAHLTPVVAGFRFASVLLAELRLMLKGRSKWWYGVAVALVAAPPFIPGGEAVRWVPALAWIWPVLLWSSLGCREAIHGTEQLVLSAARPHRRQLPAMWLAGVVVAAASGAGIAAYLAIHGEMAGLLGWIVGVLFIPSLGLALGTLSRSGKAFEVIYAFWWYAGPVSRLAPLDFTGLSGGGTALPYLLMTAGLLLVALAGRARWTA